MALRVPKAELTGFTGAMIKWMGRRMFGEVPEPAEVMWHHPRLVSRTCSPRWKGTSWSTRRR